MLDPVIPTEYCAKDSFSFCKEVQEVSSSNKFMISYNVCSLFTSIPLKETIDIAVNLIFDKYPDLKITRQELKKLFEFATSGTHFLFDGSYYDQIDGVMLGSPLCPVLANLFMGFHEKRWLDQFQFCDVLLYGGYVDDISCLFNSEQDDDEFFEFLNTQHPNIKFAFETEKDAKLAFLDVLISKTDQNLCTNVYRKTTSIALYTSFVSFTPYSYKIGLIKTLIHPTYEISSSWTSFNEEISNVKHLLMKNMYPSYVIDKQVKRFLHNKFSTNYCNAVKESKTTLHYKLPYIGSFSNNTKKKIKELCKKFCTNSNINIVFSPFKTGDFFLGKDYLPSGLKSFVVYKFVCAGCQSFRLKLKETLHITLLKPNFNKQKEHVNITISV